MSLLAALVLRGFLLVLSSALQMTFTYLLSSSEYGVGAGGDWAIEAVSR